MIFSFKKVKNIVKKWVLLVSGGEKSGFTLIETLIAITVITTAITAAMSAAQSSLQTSFFARDHIVAFYLADEAMEYVRNIRDGNFKKMASGDLSVNWLDGIVQCVGADKKCAVDSINETLQSCDGESCRLTFQKSTGYYTHERASGDAGDKEPSRFLRYVEMRYVPFGAGFSDYPSSDALIIKSSVEWQQGSKDHSVTLTKILYNWRFNLPD